jgi:branched-subunit amino acid aminotransferase/4-amino-4-deoxychorismate lyase
MIQKPLPAYPARHYDGGIRLAAVDVRRNHPPALDPAIKSSNLLNNILAVRGRRRAAATSRCCSTRTVSGRGRESTNLFIVWEGAL